ncbi:MAG: hypothetical protein BZ136_07495 [Methanosphaera sp. rholeuAM74]|nr:MAG: hypothetical protein BZ136_07495 [Methanosphaera sp. rholeuAM74]
MQIQDFTTGLLLLEIILSVYVVSKYWGEHVTGIGLEPDRDRDGFWMNSSHYDHGTSSTVGALMIIFGVIIEFATLFGLSMYLENMMPVWVSCLIEGIIIAIIFYFMLKSAWAKSEENEIECLRLNKDNDPYSSYMKYKRDSYEKYHDQIYGTQSSDTRSTDDEEDEEDSYIQYNKYPDDFRRP